MHKNKILIATALLALLVSCNIWQEAPINATNPPTTTPLPVVEFELPATQFDQEVQATIEASATASLQEAQELETQTAILHSDQASATAEMLSQATEIASPMSSRIEKLYAEGVLTSNEGTYYQLPDFTASWAMRGNYDFLLTEHTVSDFVIQSTVDWESADGNVDYWNAGCGFVFRLIANGDHYLVFLGSDGKAYLYLVLDHQLVLVDSGRYKDTPSLTGHAALLFAVQGERITLFVEDSQILQLEDDSLSTGFLGHAIASGTNKDFGTTCRMTGNELWKLAGP